jgi:pimeloyl-ACP methyl ester carboxylesterase
MPPTRGRTYVAGVSEGGLIAALLAERAPDVFSGALSACGPIGDFRKQINYFGDFRVLFDYFFGQVVPIPNSPIDIAPGVMAGWESVYEPAVTRAVRTRPDLAGQLVRTSKAAVDRNDPSTVQNTITGLLWYNVFATNDAREQLGGSPYDNRGRWYWGSANDVRLNLRVQRFSADPAALAALAPYETSGRPQIPLVTLHTTGDEIIPFWHQLLYRRKFDPSGGGSFLAVPVFRYGHCNFTAKEVLRAFGLLVLRVTGGQPEGLTEQLTIEQARADFARARVPAAAQLQRDAQLQQQHAGGR